MLYLDSAAIVKLVHAEPESETLRSWLAERAETGWVSSVLAEVESFRALARYSPGAISRLPSVLDLIEMVEIDPAIRISAQAVAPATVRSLDAIHLATALRFGEQLSSFVTYDKRLADAAEDAGLRVDMPAR
jgi:predicted nucleic acid-binding protein